MERIIQYQIVSTCLNSEVGEKPPKTRYFVVISPKELNRHLPTVLAVPVTTKNKKLPTRIEFRMNGNPAWIALEQICTLYQQAIATDNKILFPPEIEKIKSVLQEMLVR